MDQWEKTSPEAWLLLISPQQCCQRLKDPGENIRLIINIDVDVLLSTISMKNEYQKRVMRIRCSEYQSSVWDEKFERKPTFCVSVVSVPGNEQCCHGIILEYVSFALPSITDLSSNLVIEIYFKKTTLTYARWRWNIVVREEKMRENKVWDMWMNFLVRPAVVGRRSSSTHLLSLWLWWRKTSVHAGLSSTL